MKVKKHSWKDSREYYVVDHETHHSISVQILKDFPFNEESFNKLFSKIKKFIIITEGKTKDDLRVEEIEIITKILYDHANEWDGGDYWDEECEEKLKQDSRDKATEIIKILVEGKR